MAVTEFTAAISGSGKTYRRCAHYLATEFLPMRLGKIWTNFPIHIDQMVADVVEHNPQLVAVDIKDRIKCIPDEVLRTWRDYKSGPWDYFHAEDLEGDRIALDELHNYVPASAPREYVKKWQEFLGEIRHRGCEFEGLSQYDTKVHVAIRNEAGLKRDLFNCEQRRDPFFQILMADWYNLRAKFFTGQYTSSVFEYEYVPVQGRWKIQHTLKFRFEPRFFALYDSFSTPVAGGKKASGPRLPWIEKTKPQLVLWFLRRNWFHVAWRLVVVVLVFWLCFFGGASMAINGFMGLQKGIMDSNSKRLTASPATSPASSSAGGVVQASPVSGGGAPVRAAGGSSRPGGGAAGGAEASASGPGGVGLDAQLIEKQRFIGELEEKISSLTKERDELKRQLDRQSDITLLGLNYAVTRAGYHLAPGDDMPSGPHQGKKVLSFDYKRRCVVLSDGVRLNLSK